ncbi:MAG: nucleotidyltransferase family protein [Bacteroidaceae bacterium]|jgi:NDP-sugar pyrophosphorylase family protein|nr:nucleotidyltransferase family protein [Bacteroidaceae bacterium]
MKTMIFAAGLGTRLKPMTDTMPKALVPVGGRPLLQILLEKLARHGCTEAVINVHHFADMIEEWCASNDMGVSIRFSDERAELLETGGGIRHAMPLLSGERFLIHNVDILSNADLARFYAEGEGKAATLLVSERKTQRYLLFDESMRLVGWINEATGQVKSPYPDLQPDKCRRYAFSGIHQIDPVLFPRFEGWPAKFSIIDFYLSICRDVPVYGHLQEGFRLMDVGKLDTLTQAELFLKEI